MSTNPNNAIGTNGAYGGRTSVNAFNDIMAALSSGIVSGWGCSPDTGMSVVVGGDGNTRDVAIAEDNAGNRTSINNISGAPVSVTIAAAPGANSRIDVVVAYVDNPPTGNNTTVDNPDACGIIAVSGTAASSPVAPDDNAVRTAITADGASGTTAYYVILAKVTVASGTTDIAADDIEAGGVAKLTGTGVVASGNIDYATLSGNYSETEVDTGFTWIDGKQVFKKTVDCGYLASGSTTKEIPHNITFDKIIKIDCFCQNNGGVWFPIPYQNPSLSSGIRLAATTTNIEIQSGGMDRTSYYAYATVYYTKPS